MSFNKNFLKIQERNVCFTNFNSNNNENSSECRLKRINTPHYAKGMRINNSGAIVSTYINTKASSNAGKQASIQKYQQNFKDGMREVELLVLVDFVWC